MCWGGCSYLGPKSASGPSTWSPSTWSCGPAWGTSGGYSWPGERGWVGYAVSVGRSKCAEQTEEIARFATELEEQRARRHKGGAETAANEPPPPQELPGWLGLAWRQLCDVRLAAAAAVGGARQRAVGARTSAKRCVIYPLVFRDDPS